MKKCANIVFSSVVIVLLGLLVWGMHSQEYEDYSYYENRDLKEYPQPQWETVLDGSWFTGVEGYLCDHAANREEIQVQSTWLDLHVFRRPMVNEVVVTEEALLPFQNFEALDQEMVRQGAEAISENLNQLNELVTGYGGTYCYVAVPCQYAYCADRYPWYLNNRSAYTEASLTALEQALDARDVPFLDLAPVYAAEGWPMKYSSTVDNHFSMLGAYRAYQRILAELNQLSGRDDLPILQEEELIFAPVEEYYMGSRTRKLFNLIENTERLYTVEPVTPVHFIRHDYDNQDPSSELLYYYRGGVFPLSYTMYMGGDVSITKLETARPELPTVLIYGDSFTNALECLLYLSCDTMYSIDMRGYTSSTLSEFIEEIQPDYVFCLRDYESLLITQANGGI